MCHRSHLLVVCFLILLISGVFCSENALDSHEVIIEDGADASNSEYSQPNSATQSQEPLLLLGHLSPVDVAATAESDRNELISDEVLKEEENDEILEPSPQRINEDNSGAHLVLIPILMHNNDTPASDDENDEVPEQTEGSEGQKIELAPTEQFFMTEIVPADLEENIEAKKPMLIPEIVEVKPNVVEIRQPVPNEPNPKHKLGNFDSTGEPIQLIYPSENHEILIVNETSLKLLSSINRPVAIVGVLGPLHSGKSFLMNQLMNRTSGFALGPTTEPKTRGLWMWNTTVSRGNDSIIFLDSEGLFASNISESYDAKIFAISSLMSSYLIYNSVKFIDQSAIDYIELLARRAQLFGLKTHMKSHQQSSSIPVHNLPQFVSLPSLLWVVQDFVQELEGHDTPQEWLKSLLATRKKTETTSSSLPELFEEIDCFTLFIPEYRRDKLRHLDHMESHDLLPEYRQDMDLLRNKVFRESKVKSKGDQMLTGAGAASLLTALVEAANNGSFPDVPSIWASFLIVQAQQALSDSVSFFESQMSLHLTSIGPLNKNEFGEHVNHTISEARELFSTLTFGMADLEAANRESLLNQMKKIESNMEISNAAQLNRRCHEEYSSTRENFRSALQRLDLPMRRRVLSDTTQRLITQYLESYQSALSRYSMEQPFQVYHQELKTGLAGDANQVAFENSEQLQLAVVDATNATISMLSSLLSTYDPEELGYSTDRLNVLKKEAYDRAVLQFESKASFALEDSISAEASKIALNSELNAELARFTDTNAARVTKRAEGVVDVLVKQMAQSISEIQLPQPTKIIESTSLELMQQYISKFDMHLEDILEMEPTKTAAARLRTKVQAEADQLRKTNNLAYDGIISKSLPELESQISSAFRSFWWPPAAIEFAKQAATQRLKNENIDNDEMIMELAARFVDNNLKDDVMFLWQKLALTGGALLILTCVSVYTLWHRK